MRISIIIVSWNVSALLKRCLESIALYHPSFPTEIIVVDNASSDGSAEMIRQNFQAVNLIVNSDNRGFAAACNQGIAVASGEYCFFLNPDTEIIEGSIEKLVKTLDDTPRAAIVAPKILNPDGSIQRTIARFPTPASQLLLFFKLNRLFPTADDFNYDGGLQDCDQPMGAALLIRRSVLKEVNGFDERFFIWYEEVDLCKRIRDKGYRILYQPSAQIIHHRAKSFSQHDVIRKQVATFTSCYQYLEKHFGWRAWYSTVPMRLFTGIFGALVPPFRGRRVGEWPANRHIVAWTCVAIILLEVCSYVGFSHPTMRSIGFLGITIITFGVSCIRLEAGIAIALAELIIGSKGSLFSFPINDHTTLPVRMGIYVAIMLAWLVWSLLRRRENGSRFFSFRKSKFFLTFCLVAIFFVYAMINGWIHNTHSLVYADANAWLYFLLIVPFYDAISTRAHIMRLLAVAAGAFLMQILKVLAVLYVMSHKGFGYDVLYPFYRWIRTTGIGEVTQMTDHFYRIFFQSQIYAVIAFFVLLTLLFVALRNRSKEYGFVLGKMYWVFFVGTLCSLLLCFSRSFWVALFATGVLFLVVLIRSLKDMRAMGSLLWRGVLAGIAAVAVIAGVAFFPLPSGDRGFGLDAFAQRFQDLGSEAAARSRWELLPVLVSTIQSQPFVGYGFGKTVTYTSHDPRVLEINPSGKYTTYAFEWGYLDLWVKLGLLGLIALLILIGQILLVGWRAAWTVKASSSRDHALLLGLWFGFISLLFVHVFTPYIVHPLGIGILIVAALCFERFQTTKLSP